MPFAPLLVMPFMPGQPHPAKRVDEVEQQIRMGGGERAIRQQPGVENRGFHPFRAGHHSVLDVPGDDGRHVHERARPGVQDRPFLAVGSDIGQAARSPKGYSRNRAIPYSKRRWCAAWGRRAGRRGAAPVPTAYSNRLRAKTSSIWPARDSWTPSPPPETASGKMCRNSDASAILLRILRRSIFCSVSSNRYPH